jgi:CRP/FNR family transcriptional regulator
MEDAQLHHSLQGQTLPAALRERLPALPTISVSAGEAAFMPQDRCAGFPVLEQGRLRVLCEGADGRSLLLYRVHQGETCTVSLGCLLSGRRYNARGEAEIDCRLRLLPAVEFDQLMRGDAGFRNFVLAQVGERMAALMQRIDALAFQRFDQRLASHLLSGPAPWHCTHQDLADELGCAREIVSRALGSFTDAGWVRLARGSIDIIDAEALARLAANPR